MNLLKGLTFGSALVVMLAVNPLYAADTKPADQNGMKLTSAETGSLATVAAIDKSEIMVSVIAANKKTNSDVADFAKMMIDQHGSNLTQILEMVDAAHATNFKSSTAEKMKAQNMKDMMKLAGLKGDQFDKAYIDAMVAGHEEALKLIDTQLMKTAKSEEVKKFLTDTRAAVEQHLEHAKKIQANMKS